MNFEKMVTLHFQKTGVGKKTYVTKKNTNFFFFKLSVKFLLPNSCIEFFGCCNRICSTADVVYFIFKIRKQKNTG